MNEPQNKQHPRGFAADSSDGTRSVPGAIDINGALYLRNAQGDLVALANIRPMDLLMDEMVRKVAGYAEDLSAELVRFAAHTDADIAALDALIAQDYGVEPRDTKGNRTFVSFDGLLKVQVAVSERIVLGPELQAAKAVLDAMIKERGEGVDAFLMTLITRAFRVDQEGRVDVRAILALRRMAVDDPRWPDFCRAIDDAVRVVGSKRYIRVYRRETKDGRWEMIPLDLAAVEPTPAAFERRSLRRQVEELTGQAAEARRLLCLAQMYGEDGALAAMCEHLDRAREALGDPGHGPAVPGIAGATAPSYVRLWLASLPPALLAEAIGGEVAASVQRALGELSQAAE